MPQAFATQVYRLFRHIQGHFGSVITAGALVVVPLGLTIFIFKVLFSTIDGFLSDVASTASAGRVDVPVGLSIAFTLVLFYLVGLIVVHFGGHHLFGALSFILERIPIIKSVYIPVRQFTESVSGSANPNLKRVVVVEWPRPGVKSIGFVTGDARPLTGDDNLVAVYIPTTPIPTSGFLAFLPESDIHETDITMEEAIKMVISGGLAGGKRDGIESAKRHFWQIRKASRDSQLD